MDSITEDRPAIEVGAIGGSLRYWLAREGIRQGELRLAAQVASIQAMEARASSLLTWAVTIATALGAAVADSRYQAPAVCALVPAAAAAFECAIAMWPRAWDSSLPAAGHAPPPLLRSACAPGVWRRP